jgi:hypothetical protein
VNDYVAVLNSILRDAEIVNFEYWSEFIIRIQRDNAKENPELRARFGATRIPPMFCLRLRGTWWIGDLPNWKASLETYPFRGAPPVKTEEPLQASTLMIKLGARILETSVNNNGDLTLILGDGSSLTVEGRGGQWEESWLLELPVDDPDRGRWSIVCDSQGMIGGSLPTLLSFEQ